MLNSEMPTENLHFQMVKDADRLIEKGIDPVSLYQALMAVSLDIMRRMLPDAIIADTLRDVAEELERGKVPPYRPGPN